MRLLDSTRVVGGSAAPPAALAAGEAGDDDAEEGDDGVDDGLDGGGDGVNNGHDAVADCAEDRLDLHGVRRLRRDSEQSRGNIRMILRRPW
jgi:hypothetical protein